MIVTRAVLLELMVAAHDSNGRDTSGRACDEYRAAVILHHAEAYARARRHALEATRLGHPNGSWIFRCAIDRELVVSTGRQ